MLKYDFKLDNAPVRGGAMITCDNEFTLFINGREADRSTEWTQLHSIPLHTLLKKGDNQISVICKNAGDSPNAAGFYFASQLVFEKGDPKVIVSDTSWKWSNKVPAVKEGRLGALAKDFQDAQIVPTIGAWKDQIDPQASQVMSQLSNGALPMVRASLLKNTALMRSLGRPMREQIVSMRPTELTTLEAIDLANEAELSQAFANGAAKLVLRFEGDSKRLVDYLYQLALSRNPTVDEQQLLIESLGSQPNAEAVQDALWAIFMLPEFWLIQ